MNDQTAHGQTPTDSYPFTGWSGKTHMVQHGSLADQILSSPVETDRLRRTNGRTYTADATGCMVRFPWVSIVTPRRARRCKIAMSTAAAVMIVMRVGIVIAAPTIGDSTMTLDQKFALVMSVCITGILAAALFVIAVTVSVGETVRRATIIVAIMFTILGIMVALSYQPVMDFWMYVLHP